VAPERTPTINTAARNTRRFYRPSDATSAEPR
jgi:hypothetical protein